MQRREGGGSEKGLGGGGCVVCGIGDRLRESGEKNSWIDDGIYQISSHHKGNQFHPLPQDALPNNQSLSSFSRNPRPNSLQTLDVARRIWCTVSQRKNHERSRREGFFSAAGDLLRIMWLPFLPSSMQLQPSSHIIADQ